MLRILFSSHLLLAAASLALIPAQTHPSLAQTAGSHENREVERGARYVTALNLLEAHGYASFSNFREEGDKFGADVVDNGRPEHVVIDPENGQIMVAGAMPQTQSGGAR
jgi:hypothetical protein